jgi:hypothetical protein
LSKSYYMVEDEEPILERAEGTEIEWLPGKNLTQKVLRKKPKKGSKNTKPVTKTEQVLSFFNFFSPPTIPEDDIDEQEVGPKYSFLWWLGFRFLVLKVSGFGIRRSVYVLLAFKGLVFCVAEAGIPGCG